MAGQAHFVRPSGVIRWILGRAVQAFFMTGEAVRVAVLNVRNLGRPALTRRIRLRDQFGDEQRKGYCQKGQKTQSDYETLHMR